MAPFGIKLSGFKGNISVTHNDIAIELSGPIEYLEGPLPITC